MRVLLVTRLFSGLESSVVSGRWEPTGAPAIYRLIEALDRSNGVSLILTDKTDTVRTRDQVTSLAGLSGAVAVLAGPSALPRWLGKLRTYLSEARQVWRVLWEHGRQRPDVAYVDRGNLWVASALARWTRTPVVYRVMGVSPAMRAAHAGSNLVDRLHRWMLRAPFRLVICTEDGSGGTDWLPRMLSPAVPREVLVNGVDLVPSSDRDTRLDAIPADRTRVLFAGRLEEIKGAEEFVRAFLRARTDSPGRLHAVIMGNGPLQQAMRDAVERAGAGSDVTFLGAVPHRHVWSVYQACPVYVTLNRMGSLSNTTLEALAAGCCVVLPRSDAITYRDLSTDRMLPDQAGLRIASVEDEAGLAAALVRLHDDPALRGRIALAGRAASAAFLNTWDKRITREIELIVAAAST